MSQAINYSSKDSGFPHVLSGDRSGPGVRELKLNASRLPPRRAALVAPHRLHPFIIHYFLFCPTSIILAGICKIRGRLSSKFSFNKNRLPTRNAFSEERWVRVRETGLTFCKRFNLSGTKIEDRTTERERVMQREKCAEYGGKSVADASEKSLPFLSE